jgi:hypothetical protein
VRGIAPRSSRVQVRVAGPGFSYEAVGGAFHRENPSTSVKALITFAWLWRLEEGRPRRCAVGHPATLGTNPGFRGYPAHDSLRLGQCPHR